MMQTAPRILLAVSLALVLAFGAATDTRAYDRPEGSSGFTQKTLAKAKRHMVVAANPLAAEAGLATLRKGGSTVDAAFVSVAHCGAPSHPIAGSEPAAHTTPGGVAMNLPHASWCMSMTE